MDGAATPGTLPSVICFPSLTRMCGPRKVVVTKDQTTIAGGVGDAARSPAGPARYGPRPRTPTLALWAM